MVGIGNRHFVNRRVWGMGKEAWGSESLKSRYEKGEKDSGTRTRVQKDL